MQRAILLTSFLLTGVLAAQADDERLKFEGALQVTSQTNECDGQYDLLNNQRVRYYAQFDPQTPRSSLVLFTTGATELIQLVNDGQFNGSNHYNLYRISGGEFAYFKDHSGYLTQPLQFTSAPVTVTPSTLFVTLQGELVNYGGVMDCNITVRAALVRIDGDMPGY